MERAWHSAQNIVGAQLMLDDINQTAGYNHMARVLLCSLGCQSN